jgi:hypothetical protein
MLQTTLTGGISHTDRNDPYGDDPWIKHKNTTRDFGGNCDNLNVHYTDSKEAPADKTSPVFCAFAEMKLMWKV